MSNVIYPSPTLLPGQTWNITRAPSFATKTQQAVGGQVIAAAFQPYAIYRYQLEYEFLRTYTPASGVAYTEWQRLLGFFLARQGSFDTFLFHDPEDYTVTLQLIGVGTGSLTTFQLGRTMGSQFFEPIYNVDATTQSPKIYKSGVLQTNITDYSIGATGLVTFVVPPAAAAAIQWTGDYYWRCRFEQDATEFGMFAQHFWYARQVSFLTTIGA